MYLFVSSGSLIFVHFHKTMANPAGIKIKKKDIQLFSFDTFINITGVPFMVLSESRLKN